MFWTPSAASTNSRYSPFLVPRKSPRKGGVVLAFGIANVFCITEIKGKFINKAWNRHPDYCQYIEFCCRGKSQLREEEVDGRRGKMLSFLRDWQRSRGVRSWSHGDRVSLPHRALLCGRTSWPESCRFPGARRLTKHLAPQSEVRTTAFKVPWGFWHWTSWWWPEGIGGSSKCSGLIPRSPLTTPGEELPPHPVLTNSPNWIWGWGLRTNVTLFEQQRNMAFCEPWWICAVCVWSWQR